MSWASTPKYCRLSAFGSARSAPGPNREQSSTNSLRLSTTTVGGGGGSAVGRGESIPSPQPRVSDSRALKPFLEWLKVLAVILVAIALGELPAVKGAASVIDEQRSWLLPLTIALTGVGLLVLIWGWVRIGIMLGRPMSHEEVDVLTPALE